MKIRFIPVFTILSFILLLNCATQKPGIRERVLPDLPVVEREFRAAWIASVANINWPSKPGLSTEEQKEEAIMLLDLLKDHNFNAAILQIRPQCDALYESNLEPWSYYLTGEQGKAPEPYYDPLEFWIEEAHKRGIELHAWLNPYRAHHSSGGEVTQHSIARKRPELALELSSGMWWLDPAKKATREHSLAVVMDIVDRYDVDGIHFDDYFYPYPSYHETDFPDDESWQAYVESGGDLSRGDWRRENVNKFIKRVYESIKKEKPYVKLGLSPFGIWRPGNPPSIQGFDQYDQLYADARLWLNKGWLDYWTPQLYWAVNQIPQSYPVLLGWWEQQNVKDRHIFPGINIGRFRGDRGIDETINQIMITRGMLPQNPGVVHWSIGQLVSHEKLVNSLLKGPYKRQALAPAYPWLDKKAPEEPQVTTEIKNDSLKASWSHEKPGDVFNWIVYYKYGNNWNYRIMSENERSKSIPLFSPKNRNIQIDSVNAENISSVLDPVSRILVSAVDRAGNESYPAMAALAPVPAPQIASIEKYFPESGQKFHLPFLGEGYEKFKFSEIVADELKVDHVIEYLKTLKDQFPENFHYEEIGRSVQDRPIHLVRMGKGETKILLWSQMHGDEPTATAALFDVFNYLLQNRDDSFVQNILQNTTILAVPMLNPDGADVFQRRNAQDLDINRDARDLQSPEGKILFQLKEKYQPEFGFNLHDQDARITVGKTNKIAALALMAPPFDSENRDNFVRTRAKKIVAVIRQALAPYLEGHIAKYGADYMPRAFGDSMQNWGVSTILIESGGWYSDRYDFLQKMNFIALMSCFHAIADGSYKKADTAIYDDLPKNGDNLYDLMIWDVTVIDGTGIPPFRADIAINYEDTVGSIVDIGDMNGFAAKDSIDGTDLTLTPGFVGMIHDAVNEKEIIKKSRDLIKEGFTTILFSVKKEHMQAFRKLNQSIDEKNIPANLGAVLYLDKRLRSSADTLQALRYLENMLGVIGDKNVLSISDSTKFLNKPAVPLNDLNQKISLETLDPKKIKSLSLDLKTLWKIPQRGVIRREQIADFILFSDKSDSAPEIQAVFVKGHPVWQNEFSRIEKQ